MHVLLLHMLLDWLLQACGEKVGRPAVQCRQLGRHPPFRREALRARRKRSRAEQSRGLGAEGQTMVQQRQDLDAEEQEAREWSQMMVEEEVQRAVVVMRADRMCKIHDINNGEV